MEIAKPIISYATVREYNLLKEELPELTPIGVDLKDFQRPWVVRKILESYSTGKILEVGADRCELADYLSKRGFEVWVIDVYDHFGGGAAKFTEVKEKFTNLNIYRGFLHENRTLPSNYFDVIYSCSVLEHTPFDYLKLTLERIRDCLRDGGLSIHAVDFTVAGAILVNYPFIDEILQYYQADLTAEQIAKLALADIDTFFLSPQGHLRWRQSQKKNYDQYPYRKVTSLNIVAAKHNGDRIRASDNGNSL